ncbi:type 1 glutamine amidotransferase [Spongiactinospora rosea]|uniref:Type 1 glutamine amidotransferase n=1 Tax=Spongiactinospora rosea TaxID=2248750 RepID=A0A366M628_9ACTN|nr:type 1 glutamine amidotransferase [Spongiactinospora rosea]RBQ20989.1 type 1 glutamine amidotransferase [Spongiactinospora rosea]
MTNWLVVQHIDFEGPGGIASVAAERGVVLETRKPYLGDALPTVDEIDGLVVMGGPMGALDDDDHPHLATERALLAEAVKRGMPVLGVCLGAQLMAAALGAEILQGPAPEIGLGTVSLTEDGLRDPVFGPVGRLLPVFHWHGDTFTAPPGTVRLAQSANYANQAFRAGDRAYGLQFHVELDGGLRDAVTPHLPEDVKLDPGEADVVEQTGRALLGRLLDRMLS